MTKCEVIIHVDFLCNVKKIQLVYLSRMSRETRVKWMFHKNNYKNLQRSSSAISYKLCREAVRIELFIALQTM